MSDSKLNNNKISIFTQAIDTFYSKECKDQSLDSNYSYDGCDVIEIDKILSKSSFSKIEEEINDYSSLANDNSNKNSGVSEIKRPDNNVKINLQQKKNRKLTDFFQQPWVETISSLKKQVSNRIDKNNFLEGNLKVSSRKLTFDIVPSIKFKNNSGFN